MAAGLLSKANPHFIISTSDLDLWFPQSITKTVTSLSGGGDCDWRLQQRQHPFRLLYKSIQCFPNIAPSNVFCLYVLLNSQCSQVSFYRIFFPKIRSPSIVHNSFCDFLVSSHLCLCGQLLTTVLGCKSIQLVCNFPPITLYTMALSTNL